MTYFVSLTKSEYASTSESDNKQTTCRIYLYDFTLTRCILQDKTSIIQLSILVQQIWPCRLAQYLGLYTRQEVEVPRDSVTSVG